MIRDRKMGELGNLNINIPEDYKAKLAKKVASF